MISQRNQDTQDQVSESVSREQYEVIANRLLFWLRTLEREGRASLNDVRYLADMREVERLGLNGDR